VPARSRDHVRHEPAGRPRSPVADPPSPVGDPVTAPADRLTRRQVLRTTLGAAGLAVTGGGVYGVDRVLARSRAVPPPALPAYSTRSKSDISQFVSRPDLRPPAVGVSGAPSAPGYALLGPGSLDDNLQQGPLILDETGDPVWFKPLPKPMWAANFVTGRYADQPVLAWWEGVVVSPGFGQGEGVIVDRAYRELARVRAGNGRLIDMHEFRLTPEGTVLFTCYPPTITGDLSAIGGPTDGHITESVIQEVDIRTGKLLMEWRSLEHVPITESYRNYTKPYDYFHANSIAILPDGNLLVSARHTWTLYKLDRHTGEILWRLGGKRSDFDVSTSASFSWQHDARVVSESQFTVFDNASMGPQTTSRHSRALVLNVDERRRSASLQHSYQLPQPVSASAMGSVQVLPNGNVLVGWGVASHVSEFTAGGTLVSDDELPRSLYTYRSFREDWIGAPADAPAVKVRSGASRREHTVYVSWNGDTRTRYWELHAGPHVTHLRPVGIAPRHGFETAISLTGRHRQISVTALGAGGRHLGHSPVIRLPD
jgi:hypothetical protein